MSIETTILRADCSDGDLGEAWQFMVESYDPRMHPCARNAPFPPSIEKMRSLMVERDAVMCALRQDGVLWSVLVTTPDGRTPLAGMGRTEGEHLDAAGLHYQADAAARAEALMQAIFVATGDALGMFSDNPRGREALREVAERVKATG